MSHPKFKILVVDDDLKNIQVGINFLKQNENYHLVFATSGQQALERVKDTAFDLILLDIVMPTMDGFEVCRLLKKNEETKQIPVIFLTAKHEEESLIQGFKAGGADYITKPFNAAELNARVKTHLDLHYYYKQEIAKLQQTLLYSQKAETIKFIASGIAHDCKNFLSGVPFTLQLLEKEMESRDGGSDSHLDLINSSKVAVDKVSGLLDQFFSFSKEDEDVQEIVDMNEVVTDISKVYKGWVRHKINFNIELLSQPALILADKLHVEQVLLNMLINAQHAVVDQMEQSGVIGKIDLTIDKELNSNVQTESSSKTLLKITISDNGIGMSEEIQDKMFDLYFSTKKKSGGSGLGLAVSKHIIERHHGSVKVESVQGEGTVFTIFLPLNE